MKVGDAIADHLKRERVELALGHPLTHVITPTLAAGRLPNITQR